MRSYGAYPHLFAIVIRKGFPLSSSSVQNDVRATTRREVTVVGVVIAGAFLAILNQTVLSPALPALMEAFQVNAATAQ